MPHHYWPKELVNFARKRVAVIGTGASAVQTIPEVAKTDARHCQSILARFAL